MALICQRLEYGEPMQKTTVYLSSDQVKLLALIAADRGCSQAELIRDAVQRLVDSTVLPLPNAAMAASGEDPVLPPGGMKQLRDDVFRDLDTRRGRGRAASA